MSPAYNQAASDKSNLCAVLNIIQKIEKEKKKNIRKKKGNFFPPSSNMETPFCTTMMRIEVILPLPGKRQKISHHGIWEAFHCEKG